MALTYLLLSPPSSVWRAPVDDPCAPRHPQPAGPRGRGGGRPGALTRSRLSVTPGGRGRPGSWEEADSVRLTTPFSALWSASSSQRERFPGRSAPGRARGRGRECACVWRPRVLSAGGAAAVGFVPRGPVCCLPNGSLACLGARAPPNKHQSSSALPFAFVQPSSCRRQFTERRASARPPVRFRCSPHLRAAFRAFFVL